MKEYLTLAWQNKTIRTITITALVTAVMFSMCGCSKSEAPDCQSCHTVEYIMTNSGWSQIESQGFVDCQLIVKNEDRTYEAGSNLYRRVTKCVK